MEETTIIQPRELSPIEQMSRGEIDIQISTAKAYPRSIKRSVDEAKSLATMNTQIAETMGYAIPRGGKIIRGPSVRLAEIVGSSWGNLRYGARIIAIGETTVTAQGTCHDLEKNIAAQHEVQRRITNKNGKRFPEDLIVVTCNAACAIALREAIFKVVPRSLVADVYDAAMKVSVGNAKSLAERRQKALDYFNNKLQIVTERILAALGRESVEQITLDDLGLLNGMKTAIKDGEATIESVFPEAEVSFTKEKKKPKEKPEPGELPVDEPEAGGPDF